MSSDDSGFVAALAEKEGLLNGDGVKVMPSKELDVEPIDK